MIGFSRYKFWESITRKYYDADGKLVATNRHKAMEQKSDSLAEYRATYGEQNVCQLTVKAHSPAYKDMLGVMRGACLQTITGIPSRCCALMESTTALLTALPARKEKSIL